MTSTHYPTPPSDIVKAFQGQKVEVMEQERSVTSTRLGETYTFNEYNIAPGDTVIPALSKAAASHGLHLRVWLPGIVGTCDYRTDRLNVHIERTEPKGDWKIGRFDIG